MESEFIVDKENMEVRTSRVFNTTPERLWRACTQADQVVQWWGPAKYETTVDQLDFKVGGKWRFVQKDENGDDYAFNGVYKEIDEPNKIVWTFEFEPYAGHVHDEVALFEAVGDGKTKMTTIAKFENMEDLEGMVGSGMEGGQRESMDRLAELVKN